MEAPTEPKKPPTFLTPLSFSAAVENRPNSEHETVGCLKCTESFEMPRQKDVFLGHLFMEHRLVIADAGTIANLTQYLIFWQKEFKGKAVTD